MSKITTYTLVLVILIGMTGIVSASETTPGVKFPDNTPVQSIIKQSYASGTFSASTGNEPEYETKILEKTNNSIKMESVTKLKFNNPREAGYSDNSWASSLSAENATMLKRETLSALTRNVSDPAEKAKITNEWNNYGFEHGERTYVITETYDVSVVDASAYSDIYGIYSGDILTGFTKIWISNINRHYSVRYNGNEIGSADVEFKLDGALGLRLPMNAQLEIPEGMQPGTYNIYTSIKGLDWDTNSYSSSNVPVENGYEFVARFRGSIDFKASVGSRSFGPYTFASIEFNKGKNFVTPIGSNEQFLLPAIFLNPIETGLYRGNRYIAWAGIGIRITPSLGSDKVVAKWRASGDSSGSGEIIYSSPNTDYSFSIQTGDYDTSTNRANIELYDFKYYFSICKVTVGGNIQTGGWLLPDVGTDYLDIFSISCSDLTSGLYLGTHSGTSANHVDGSSIVTVSSTTPPPTPTQTPTVYVTVKTDKLIYNYGDAIPLSVKNNGQQSVYVYEHIYVKDIISGEQYPSVWAALAPESPIEISPGETYYTDLKQYITKKGYYNAYIPIGTASHGEYRYYKSNLFIVR